ncbi:hypothetical protein A2865_04195 [Candidatus Woesebacteria bacterium RIFCSPHIGHO2_01_FULL_39_17]|uniref:Uncharacterized protein n=3 Tax=Candidatus Woeseibacteriota TaxID=1752722 RepID=A0A0G0QV61_9BACT|nr:MAG: hypothetical protein US72_C0005G0071 [Microgenomates group bacterium GW2011_GWC1_38_12]KKQ94268.1 MAG: hypothetical protein UT19_C0003G0073 [Candidatus Woesebacteria bacterium GW2011_GWB1_39_10b]KKR14205.1 MAG: hypothetical protein UT40_C0004G0028 [Candidatus Woesebacteria bacterium GW2011_GWA1_39_21b]OGM22658.1 MAG: hypothetical protein A2865_04195 [Candidatus Woesebacteria bacterium RIFCSPHIGHO2_01_FULL_39_17]OGM63573.1 MAG: hypothetical protein A3A52_01135 [Candidatus Woesebacteria b
MRKVILLIFFLFIAAFVPVYSFAQTLTPSSVGQQKRLEVQEKLEEKKAQREVKLEERQLIREEKRATREARLSEKRIERIRHFWQLLRRRLLAAVERLERLIGRIESRLAIIGGANEDLVLDDVLIQVADAKEMLAGVITNIEAADVEVETALASQEPKMAFEIVRSLVKEIKTDLMAIHRILVHVIGDIKGLRVGQGGAAEEIPTPTSAVTPTEIPITETPTPTVEVTPTVEPTGGV